MKGKRTGISALLISAILMNLLPVTAWANEGAAGEKEVQWAEMQERLANYTPTWNDTNYDVDESQRMIETALMGNGDVGVSSSGNSNEKTYLISKQDFWNCGDMNTDNIGGADLRRVSPLSVGGLTLREKRETVAEVKPDITGCGFITDSNPNYVYDLEGIMDGRTEQDKDTWACNGKDHPDTPKSHWFEINLNEVKRINGYVISHHLSPEMYTSDFEVEVSLDGSEYTSVQKVIDNKEQQTRLKFDEPKEIQYIRVHIPKPNAGRDGTVRILEMELLEEEAAEKKVTGCGFIDDSDPNWVYGLNAIIDDKMQQDNQTWACNGKTHEGEKNTHWFQVDFGQVRDLKKYILYHQGAYQSENGAMNTADFEVQISLDGKEYETVQTVTDNTENQTEFQLEVAKQARYVKVVITKANPKRDKTARIPEMRFYDNGNQNIITGEMVYDFSEKLDITDGRLESNMEMAGIPVTLSSWISATENILVTEVTSRGQAALNLESALWVKSDLEGFPLDTGVDGDAVWASKKTVNFVENQNPKSWTSEVVLKSKVLGTSATATKNSKTESGLSFVLEPGETVQIVTAIGGGGQNFDSAGVRQGMEPQMEAGDLLERFQNSDDLSALKVLNDEWWKDYWLKSFIDIGDEQLHRYYYGSLYYMACSSREDTLASGLYGIWTTTDGAMWNGDYHMNYNFIAPFYGMHSSNRSEFAKSLKDPLLAFMEEGKQRAKTDLANIYGAYINGGNQPGENGTVVNNGKFDGRPDLLEGIDDGVLYPVALGPWGSYAWGGKAGGYLTQVYNAGFSAQGLTAYYNYTKDGDYLKEVYPFLLANANFYEKWCEKEDLGNGKYRYNIWSGAHEGTFDLNAGTAIGTVKNILECLIDGTNDGNIFPPAEKLAVWKDMYDNFAEYPIQNFIPQPGADFTFDKPYIPLSEVGVKLRNGEANVALEFIAPSQQLGFDSDPELREAARNSIELKEKANGNMWFQINDTPKVYLQAMRCGYNPQYVKDKFKALLDRSMRENFVIQDGYHGIEKAGAIEFINNMLLQSDKGIIKLFPNWTGEDASFTRLRERGAFLLSSSMTEGKVDYVEITSEKGGMVKLVQPWEHAIIKVVDQNGKEIGFKTSQTVNTGEKTIEFPMDSNDTVRIEYVGEKPADYTKVDAALAKVPADLTLYTKETADVVKAAVDRVNRELGIEYQEEVDKMAEDILQAVDLLVTIESVDLANARKALEKEILVGEVMLEKGQGSYTDESWFAFQTAMEYAVKMSGNNGASSKEVNAAVVRVKDAWKGLTVSMDTSEIEARKELKTILSLMGSIQRIGQGSYTDASWKVFQDSYSRGTSVLGRPMATKAELLQASAELRLAVNGLTLKPATPPAPPASQVPKVGEVFTVGSLKYRISKSAASGGTVSVLSGVKNTLTEVKIPLTIKIKGYTFNITEISNKAFRNYKKLKEVSIGNHVTRIGDYAFQNNVKLRKVTLGKNVEKIGKYAFYGDRELKYINLNTSKLKSVGTSAFKKIYKKPVVKVPGKKVAAYKKLLKGKGLSTGAIVKK